MKYLPFLFLLFLSGFSFGQEVPEPAAPLTIPAPKPVVEPLEQPMIIEFPDVDARYPGGTAVMHDFVNANFVYPADALRDSVQGKVYLSFIVEDDGSLSKIVVERGLSPSTEAEAIRILHLMPKWIPGEKNGKPIATRVRMPFVFRLY